MSTCRICGKWQGEKVKYSVRHYAHYECYLEAGKPLNDLPDWQIVQFPYRLLKQYGLTNDALDAQERLRDEN